MGALCWHETTYLGQQHDECRLSQQSGLTSHIRTCDDNDLLSLLVEEDIIGHIALTKGQLCLDDWVATLTDIDYVAAVDDRTHIVMLLSSLGSTQETVEMGNDIGVLLYLWDERLSSNDEFIEETLFK